MTVIDLARERKFRKVLAHVAGELASAEKLQFPSGDGWTDEQKDVMDGISEAVGVALAVHPRETVALELEITICGLRDDIA